MKGKPAPPRRGPPGRPLPCLGLPLWEPGSVPCPSPCLLLLPDAHLTGRAGRAGSGTSTCCGREIRGIELFLSPDMAEAQERENMTLPGPRGITGSELHCREIRKLQKTASSRVHPGPRTLRPHHANAPHQGERHLRGRVAVVTMERQGLAWRLQPRETAAERTSLGNSRKTRGLFPGVLEGELVTWPVSGSDSERAHRCGLVPVEPSSVNHL